MDDIRLQYFKPVVGTPQTAIIPQTQTSTTVPNTSFGDILQEKLNDNNNVVFSKHAAKRVEERNINITATDLARLEEGIKLADSKNLNDALILVDRTAFVVNVPTSTVITTKANDEIQGDIFTNINGTVII